MRYEKNFGDAAVISNAEKVPLSLAYSVHDTEGKAQWAQVHQLRDLQHWAFHLFNQNKSTDKENS